MKLTKSIARNIVVPGLLAFGADKYFLTKSKKNCVVINFHGVRSQSAHTINNRHLPVQDFEKIISYLSRNFDIKPLSDLFEMRRRGITPTRKTVALTFDDGYLNNFEVALPVLKKYNAPATFFIITKCLATDSFYAWPDLLDAVKVNVKGDVQFREILYHKPGLVSDEGIYLADYLKTLGAATEASATQIFEANADATKELQRSPELLRLVDASQLAAYKHEPLLEFGSHSHSHPNMEFLSRDQCAEQVKTSISLLEKVTGKKPVSIAFPDGSYNEETLSVCRENGLNNMLAVEYKNPDTDSRNPDLLSRFTVSNSTTAGSNILRLAKSYRKYAF